ncbi:Anoctamin-4 [Portunus trituberculatus]|uniref:Anoctamin-4 n=1 Tax=Portunus trituberculatus TaxID=210409 RepID=A0A5B7D860_PORTR|nr:Anoctamin-4 [Portunus trituberculatus]
MQGTTITIITVSIATTLTITAVTTIITITTTSTIITINLFIIKDRETFFSPAQRSQIAWEILLRVRYSSVELGIGITRLLSSDTYVAAFPLHDGRYDKDGPDGALCDRRAFPAVFM